MTMPIVEHFISINGEGKKAGELSYFLRFAGCNLVCSYCDTPWAQCPESGTAFHTIDEIADLIKVSQIHNVTLTGGEPLLQPKIHHLMIRLLENGHSVEVETNGSVALSAFEEVRNFGKEQLSITMDYKLPGSHMEGLMDLENFEKLRPHDSVKFVITSVDDLEKAKKLILKYHLLSRATVFFSPVAGSIEASEIVDYLKRHTLNQVRLQLQLHKFIWSPETKGV